MTEERKQ